MTFDSGEDYNRTFVAYVPDDEDVAQLTIEIAGAKDSVLELDVRNLSTFTDSPLQESGSTMDVVETSWFQRLTQPPRVVADRWYFGDPAGSPWTTVSFPTIDPCVYYDRAPTCGTGGEKVSRHCEDFYPVRALDHEPIIEADAGRLSGQEWQHRVGRRNETVCDMSEAAVRHDRAIPMPFS